MKFTLLVFCTHRLSPADKISERSAPPLLPVPGLEGVAGPLEQVALHHHAVWSVHIELRLGVVIGKVLRRDTGRRRMRSGAMWTKGQRATGKICHPAQQKKHYCASSAAAAHVMLPDHQQRRRLCGAAPPCTCSPLEDAARSCGNGHVHGRVCTACVMPAS